MAASPIVPAWKRLGLKLKGSSTPAETQNETKSHPVIAVTSNKRKASGTVVIESPAARFEDTTPSSSKRRKSVKFADESKDVDGDENANLLSNYLAEQTGGEDQFSQAELAQFTAPVKVHAANQPSTKTKTKTKAKAKSQQNGDNSRITRKERKPRPQPSEAEPKETPPYIGYLQNYRDSRATWKFSKNYQNALLKNIFNIFRVPSEYDEAISSYLSGLQGEEAKNRLKLQARTILAETDEVDHDSAMTGTSAKDAALRAQLKSHKSMLRNIDAAVTAESPEHKSLLQKRKRAELILRSLAPGTPESQRSDDTFEDDGGLPPKRKKQRRSRKSRSGVPDDDDTDETSSVSSVPSEAPANEKRVGKNAGSAKLEHDQHEGDESSVVSSSSEESGSGSSSGEEGASSGSDSEDDD